jgi:hypothetical protein
LFILIAVAQRRVQPGRGSNPGPSLRQAGSLIFSYGTSHNIATSTPRTLDTFTMKETPRGIYGLRRHEMKYPWNQLGNTVGRYRGGGGGGGTLFRPHAIPFYVQYKPISGQIF